MRLFALAMTAFFATGCFHWAPATSLSSIEDDRVQIHAQSNVIKLEHATARGRLIEGEPKEGFSSIERFDDCAPPACARVDVSDARVMVRKLNVPATIGIIGVSAVGVGATVFLVALLTFAFASQPVLF